MEPAGPWASRLGDLYARAIAVTVDPRYLTSDEREAKSPFADDARRKLEQSNDPLIMASAGEALTLRYRGPGQDETVALGRRLLERAVETAPQTSVPEACSVTS